LAFNKTLRIYAQVNISREPQKKGFEFDAAEDAVKVLSGFRLEAGGLMASPPWLRIPKPPGRASGMAP